jgi:hypothetical protein
MSENVAELPAAEIQRGTGVSAGAPASAPAPIQESAPQPMGSEQQAALQEIGKLRASYGSTPSDQRDTLTQRIVELQRWAFGTGSKPAWYGPQTPDPKLTDMRPHDSLRDAFEAMAQPAPPEVLKFAVHDAVIKGVDRQLAQQVADTCGDLGLSTSALKDVMARVRAHHGAEHDHGPDTGLRVLDEAEAGAFIEEASRIVGSTEKFQALSQRARDFLQHKGVLAEFDRLGLTSTSLAFDPKLLLTLAHAADAAGLPTKGVSK